MSLTQLPLTAFRSRPFRVHDAIRAGVPRKVLVGPQFRRPFPGVRVPCSLPDTLEVRCQAASLIVPAEAAFSHETAAGLCDLPLPAGSRRSADSDDVPDPVAVIVEPGTVVPQVEGIAGHDGLDPTDVIEVGGLRVVSPVRTFFHLALALNLDDLVIVGDAIVRHWASRDDLISRATGLAGRRGIVRARDALALVRDGVDSPSETRVRLMLIRAGLPEPELNLNVFDEAGGWLARPDLAYRHLKIAIEYDGDHHRTDKNQWRRDRARDNNLRDNGWIVIPLTADDPVQTPRPHHRPNPPTLPRPFGRSRPRCLAILPAGGIVLLALITGKSSFLISKRGLSPMINAGGRMRPRGGWGVSRTGGARGVDLITWSTG
jgi:hypothetical protein